MFCKGRGYACVSSIKCSEATLANGRAQGISEQHTVIKIEQRASTGASPMWFSNFASLPYVGVTWRNLDNVAFHVPGEIETSDRIGPIQRSGLQISQS
jgi:hypothetical protein